MTQDEALQALTNYITDICTDYKVFIAPKEDEIIHYNPDLTFKELVNLAYE